MILILFQRGGNNNAFLVKEYCARNKISHYTLDADLYGSEDITWSLNRVPVPDDRVTGIYNSMYREAGLSTVTNMAEDFQEFAQSELHDVLLNSLLDFPNSVWMNSPTALMGANVKVHQLKVAQNVGFNVPETIVSNNGDQLLDFWNTHNKDGVVTKAIKIGCISSTDAKHVVMYTNRVTAKHIEKLKSHMSPPVLFQQEIAKKNELRTVIIDDEVYSCTVNTSHDVDWRKDGNIVKKSKPYILPQDQFELCRKTLSALNLRFGVFDIIEDMNGSYYFLEINQQGGWGWMETHLEMPISQTIVNHLLT